MKLDNIRDKRDYINFLNEQAAPITANAMHKDGETIDVNERINYIENDESLWSAVEVVDELKRNWSVSGLAQVYDIINFNYQATMEYVEENMEMRDDLHPVESFKDYVSYCIAYDISKTVDQKVDQTMKDDSSTEVVEV